MSFFLKNLARCLMPCLLAFLRMKSLFKLFGEEQRRMNDHPTPGCLELCPTYTLIYFSSVNRPTRYFLKERVGFVLTWVEEPKKANVQQTYLGKIAQVTVILSLFWKPFDLRFSDLLGRFEEHRKLFEFEMQTAYMINMAELTERYIMYEKKVTQAAAERERLIQEQKELFEVKLREQEESEMCKFLPLLYSLVINSQTRFPSRKTKGVDQCTELGRYTPRRVSAPSNGNWRLAVLYRAF